MSALPMMQGGGDKINVSLVTSTDVQNPKCSASGDSAGKYIFIVHQANALSATNVQNMLGAGYTPIYTITSGTATITGLVTGGYAKTNVVYIEAETAFTVQCNTQSTSWSNRYSPLAYVLIKISD